MPGTARRRAEASPPTIAAGHRSAMSCTTRAAARCISTGKRSRSCSPARRSSGSISTSRTPTTSRSSATSSSSTRWRSRTPSTSGSARRSTTTTTSSSSSSTARCRTTTGSSRCTASTPSASSSPSTATTAPPSPRSAPLREARRADRAPVAAALPHRRRARRQLLPDPRRLRRPHRRARGQHLPQGRRRQLQEIFRMKRLLVGMRKAITPQRDTFARADGRRRRAARPRRRGRALLPRRLRPPDPHQRPDRQLPRPAHRRDGRLPLDRLQPAQRRHEAADDHRHRSSCR